jgi:type VI secretion system protein ImpG
MRDDLLDRYNDELSYLRRTGAEFAQRYPKVAGRLQLEANKCDDPHVERLLEGFAFLAARIHLKLEDDFSEISEALLNIIYPHYIRPIPSISLVQFHLDRDQGQLTTGLRIPRGKEIYSRPVAGVPCKFETCYDTTIWPIEVSGARWLTPHELKPPIRSTEAVAALRIELTGLPEVRFSKLELSTLRLHINASSNLAAILYELLLNNSVSIIARDLTDATHARQVTLPADSVQPVGFGEHDGLIPYPRRSFLGYRLLQEYFVFPEKFFFIDVSGFDRIRAAGFGEKIELIFLIRSFERGEWRAQLEAGVTNNTFRLGATPVVNLFRHTSEPISLTQRKSEYLVIPDLRRRAVTTTYSIDDVVAVTDKATLHFEPFYSMRHAGQNQRRLYWYAKRRPVAWSTEAGTEVYISFVDESARLVQPGVDTVTTRLTCYNANLPSRLPFGDPAGDFEMPGGGPIAKIVTLIKPTPVVEPPLGKPQLWRLISQLSLNYVSIQEGGAEALRELLLLHNFSGSLSGAQQIAGIRELRGAPAYARVAGEHGISFARGIRVEIDFDEEQFAGGSVFLLASVLERFFGMYVSLNSFSVLAARSLGRKELLKEWPPRAGFKALL